MPDGSTVAQVLRLAPAQDCAWSLVAGDEQASAMLPRLAEAMRLQASSAAGERLMVLVCDERAPAFRWPSAADPRSAGNGRAVCMVNPGVGRNPLATMVRQIAAVLAWDVQPGGGVCLHGALAEWHGRGVIMAGSGGVGKTTASRRLPPQWHSLCDDVTLVLRDHQGVYWAHPWPTPSSFAFERQGSSCDVGRGVPLAAIFFLQRADTERIDPLSGPRAVASLVRSAEEFIRPVEAKAAPIVRGSSVRDLRALRLERFQNLCVMARTVPVYALHLSLSGAFWLEMERVLTTGAAGAH